MKLFQGIWFFTFNIVFLDNFRHKPIHTNITIITVFTYSDIFKSSLGFFFLKNPKLISGYLDVTFLTWCLGAEQQCQYDKGGQRKLSGFHSSNVQHEMFYTNNSSTLLNLEHCHVCPIETAHSFIAKVNTWMYFIALFTLI